MEGLFHVQCWQSNVFLSNDIFRFNISVFEMLVEPYSLCLSIFCLCIWVFLHLILFCNQLLPQSVCKLYARVRLDEEASNLRKLSRTESPIEIFAEDFVQINSKHKSSNLGVASCLKVLSRSQYNSWRENNERPHQQKPENSNVSRTQCIQNCKFARGLDSQN